jgi:capsular polysaccharide biosynthesis protein
MDLQYFLQLVKRKRKIIFGIVALFIIIAAIAVAFQPFKYSSESQLLVVQERQGMVVDAYTASKSSEHLSRVLASVVSSNSFFTKVTTTSPGINQEYFGSSPKDQIKEWGKTVSAKHVNDTGIIAISVYHTNRAEAEKIAAAVNYVLMTQHSAYDGGGDTVKVRLIDQPVTSNYPVQPNIILIGSLAVILGLITGLMYIYLFAEANTPKSNFSPLQNFAPQVPANERAGGHGHQQPNHRHNPVQPHLPEEVFASARHQRNEQPIQYNQNTETTPYGHHASVSLPERQMNEQIFEDFDDYIDPEELVNPEAIIQKGNMRNILQ